jgi:hypothetical protein
MAHTATQKRRIALGERRKPRSRGWLVASIAALVLRIDALEVLDGNRILRFTRAYRGLDDRR